MLGIHKLTARTSVWIGGSHLCHSEYKSTVEQRAQNLHVIARRRENYSVVEEDLAFNDGRGLMVVNPKPFCWLTSKIIDSVEQLPEAEADANPLLHRGVTGRIVPVDPKPRRGFFSHVMDLVEKLIIEALHDPSQKSIDHQSVCFAPVDESPPVADLPIEGRLPECLNGEFLRIGPNPRFAPSAGYHWFDGDGMIHGIRIRDGKATYVCRYVRTSRLKQEEFFGGAKFVKIGDLKGVFGFLMMIVHILRTRFKALDDAYGSGTANTALRYHHGRLLALQEADKPYVVKVLEDGDLQTLGMEDYDERLTHPFTAHPKIDPITGEMFTFGCSQKPPYVTYRVISREGFMHDPVPITIPEAVMMHDFAITENYAIFMDLPMCFRLQEMLRNNMPFVFDDKKKARFGLLPRYAKDEHQIKWFELPNCLIFHNANAWEEGDEVVLITCCIQALDLYGIRGSMTEILLENSSPELYEMRFNMRNGQASQRKLFRSTIDFPRINESYTGRKQRFVYGVTLGNTAPAISIIKVDIGPKSELEKTEDGGKSWDVFEMGAGKYASEPVFVPRKTGYTLDEDDGYLIFFVHDENTRKSSVTVIDAKRMSSEPIAVVELPRSIPYGFHATFVSEEQLREQKML